MQEMAGFAGKPAGKLLGVKVLTCCITHNISYHMLGIAYFSPRIFLTSGKHVIDKY
jgi:hypothetical protein